MASHMESPNRERLSLGIDIKTGLRDGKTGMYDPSRGILPDLGTTLERKNKRIQNEKKTNACDPQSDQDSDEQYKPMIGSVLDTLCIDRRTQKTGMVVETDDKQPKHEEEKMHTWASRGRSLRMAMPISPWIAIPLTLRIQQ